MDVHIRRLRACPETGGYDRLIQTVRGSGYRIVGVRPRCAELLTALALISAGGHRRLVRGWGPARRSGLCGGVYCCASSGLMRLFALGRPAARHADRLPPAAPGCRLRFLHRRARLSSVEREQAPPGTGPLPPCCGGLADGVLILDGHRAIEWMNLQGEGLPGLKARWIPATALPICCAGRGSSPTSTMPTIAACRWNQTQRNPGRILQVQAAPFAAGPHPCCWCAT